MEFVKRTIIDHETVISKELLDSFQDGIVEGIGKAEAALAIQPAVFNAPTQAEFPYIGSVDVIYKAETEKKLYQWNYTERKYEPLFMGGSSGGSGDSGGDSGGSDEENGDVATDEEVNDALDDIFGGGGSSNDPDDPENPEEENGDVATDDEVGDILDDIFGV